MIVLKDCLVFGAVQAVSFHGVIWLSNHFLGSFQTCWVSSLAGYQEKLIFIFLTHQAGQLKEKLLCGGDSCFSNKNRIVPGILCLQWHKIVASIWCWECWKLELRDFGQYWEGKLIWREGAGTFTDQSVIRGCGRCSSCCCHELSVTTFPSPATFEQDPGGTLPLAGRGREWSQAYQAWACWNESISMNSGVFSSVGESKTRLYLLTWSYCKLRTAGALPGVLSCWHVEPSTCGMAKKSWNTFLYELDL